MTRVLSLCLLAALLLFAPLHTADARELDDSDRADIERVQDYLNRLKTMEARFIQVSTSGQYAEGDVYISRPGKLRLDYDPPVQVQMFANYGLFIYFDTELEQVSYLDLESTPAGLLVGEDISLEGDVTITDIARGPGVLEVTLIRTEEPDNGSVTLVFSDRPLSLRKWVVNDPQGIETTVSLMNPRFGLDLDEELFEFKDPNRGRRDDR